MAIAITAVATVAVTLVVVAVVAGLIGHEKKIKYEIETLYATGHEQFPRSMGSLLPPPLRGGNRITALQNGGQIFPAMLAAIQSAQRSICFEIYIYWSGNVGKKFADALSERARAGVKVHVLLDWLGSKQIEERYVEEMRAAGAQVERYHPLHWYNAWRVNNRTHRKLLIVDGKVGFTGGVGIADEWDGNADDPRHWRDSHFQLEGPSVAQMQGAFMDNWIKTNSRVLHGEEYFPALEPCGESLAQVFMSSPQEGSESLRLMYLLSIACAERSIKLVNPYFIPDALSVKTLVDACRRGVKVQIIGPGPHIDPQVVRKAGRSRWGPLLEAGVEIYEYQPAMLHCKLLIVDDRWVSVGSANFDNRSFRLNDEANLNILDADFASAQANVFDQDRENSRRITHEEWRNRPWTEKLKEHIAGLLRPQL
jgi:cardiolipin synthase